LPEAIGSELCTKSIFPEKDVSRKGAKRAKRCRVSKGFLCAFAGEIFSIELLSCKAGSSYKLGFICLELKWRAIRDNLRNFLLTPTTEMLSFLQRL
jgi:hypothetical protein